MLFQAVEEDFVEMRKNNPESVTADDLHKMLLVARWVWCFVTTQGFPASCKLSQHLVCSLVELCQTSQVESPLPCSSLLGKVFLCFLVPGILQDSWV